VTDGQNPLSRWSQRKLAARRGDAVDEPDPAAPAGTDVQVSQPAGEPAGAQGPAGEEEAPELPSIDGLDAQSDYTVFMRKNVPEAIRRAALRKLWTSDPVLANLDGLNNYDEDYNVIDQAITLAQTSYRPGLGYFDEIKEKLDKVEDVVDRVGDGVESLAEVTQEKQRTGAGDDVSDSDAPAQPPADASRQVASLEPDEASPERTEKTGE